MILDEIIVNRKAYICIILKPKIVNTKLVFCYLSTFQSFQLSYVCNFSIELFALQYKHLHSILDHSSHECDLYSKEYIISCDDFCIYIVFCESLYGALSIFFQKVDECNNTSYVYASQEVLSICFNERTYFSLWNFSPAKGYASEAL